MDQEYAVKQFMVKHRLPYRDAPGQIDEDVALLRLRLMMEELGEVAVAMHELDNCNSSNLEEGLAKLADGLADLLYVVVGTGVAYGLPVNEVFAEVHRSNMTKTTLDDQRKGGKGEGFRAPDLLTIVRSFRPGFLRTYPVRDISGNLLGDE